MSTFVLLLLASGYFQGQQSAPAEKPAGIRILLSEVEKSGRVLTLAPSLDDRIRIAPGAPPLLAFRYLEGRQRGRFGGLDLVLDDAGH
jgi:hypothetical protein